MSTTHWTWEYTDPTKPEGPKLGKKHVINNYCIALPSNEPRCTSCHIGIGWKDGNFNFSDPTKVDCLVCHDTTGTYVKTPTGAGAPATNVNLLHVARNVGKTSRATCGACHFYGGGGDSVKHGDLDSTMKAPPRSLDVHMGVDGANFACTRCHETSHHQISGSRYPALADDGSLKTDNQTCERCHSTAPHSGTTDSSRYNSHAAVVACQTCHIPYTARTKATKMAWDWSTAGVKGSDGKDQIINDSQGNPLYDTKKGSFVWEQEVVPEYRWFNGAINYATLDDLVSSNALLTINVLGGSYGDDYARIFPVKRFTGAQPYDAGVNHLAVPHLFPTSPTDSTAYWKVYDWTNALRSGMAAVGRGFTGPVGWVQTEMFWIQNHMVAPKSEALTCKSCHTPRGRLDFAALGYPADQVRRLSTLSGFLVDSIAVNPNTGEIELSWQGTANRTYQVQFSDNAQTWSDAPGGSIATGSVAKPLSWKEPKTPGLRFYRIIRR